MGPLIAISLPQQGNLNFLLLITCVLRQHIEYSQHTQDQDMTMEVWSGKFKKENLFNLQKSAKNANPKPQYISSTAGETN